MYKFDQALRLTTIPKRWLDSAAKEHGTQTMTIKLAVKTPHSIIIEKYADKMYDHALQTEKKRLANRIQGQPELAAEHQRRYDEAIVSLTPERVEAFKARERSECRDIISEIQEQPCCLRMLNAGRFHPDNKLSREVFECVTGIKLPPTVGKTIEVIREYIGLEWLAKHEAKQAEYAKQKELDEAKAREATLADRKTYLLSIAKQCITGADLVELARMMGIEVQPQTAGVLLKKIGRIKNGTMEIYGKPSTAGAWKLYNQVIAMIDDVEPVLSPEEAKKVDEVFA